MPNIVTDIIHITIIKEYSMHKKLVKITLASEVILVTTHHRTITTQGQTYHAGVIIPPIDYYNTPMSDADSVSLNLIHHHNKNLLSGILEIFDYNLTTNEMILPARFYGKITQTHRLDNMIQIEATSTKADLAKIITRTYAPQCQAIWGDNRCGIVKSLYREHIQITHINHNLVYYTVINGQINTAYNPYLSDLRGNIIPVLTLDLNAHTFTTEPFYVFEMGQTYDLFAGCQNNQTNCIAYNNFPNYLGFT
jgi:Uncharacterized conserved protein (DUF2163)